MSAGFLSDVLPFADDGDALVDVEAAPLSSSSSSFGGLAFGYHASNP
jgi:hypothetical protein